MISHETLLKLKDILSRISKGESVGLQERLFLNKYADKDQTISMWLARARRLQSTTDSNDPIDQLLNGLDIGKVDPEPFFKRDTEDLANWFTGAPSWVARS